MSVRVHDRRRRAPRTGRTSCFLEYANPRRLPIVPLEQRFAGGVASCRWRIPRVAGFVSGALTVTAAGSRARTSYRFFATKQPGG
ncbi:MAG: hypothetical protein ABR583_02760 [Gaiellaceae bacterium]